MPVLVSLLPVRALAVPTLMDAPMAVPTLMAVLTLMAVPALMAVLMAVLPTTLAAPTTLAVPTLMACRTTTQTFPRDPGSWRNSVSESPAPVPGPEAKKRSFDSFEPRETSH